MFGSQHLGCWRQNTSRIQNKTVYATLCLTYLQTIIRTRICPIRCFWSVSRLTPAPSLLKCIAHAASALLRCNNDTYSLLLTLTYPRRCPKLQWTSCARVYVYITFTGPVPLPLCGRVFARVGNQIQQPRQRAAAVWRDVRGKRTENPQRIQD